MYLVCLICVQGGENNGKRKNTKIGKIKQKVLLKLKTLCYIITETTDRKR